MPAQLGVSMPTPQSTSSAIDTTSVSFAPATYQERSRINQPFDTSGQWQRTGWPLPTPAPGPSHTTAGTIATTAAAYPEHNTTHHRSRTERMRAHARSHIQGSGTQQNLAMIESVETVEDGVYFLIFVPNVNNNSQ